MCEQEHADQSLPSTPWCALGERSSRLSPCHLPWTVRMKCFSSRPATFSATHVYVPELESCRRGSCSTREPGRRGEQGVRAGWSWDRV